MAKQNLPLKIFLKVSDGLVDIWALKTMFKGKLYEEGRDQEGEEYSRTMYTIEFNKHLDDQKTMTAKPIVEKFVTKEERDNMFQRYSDAFLVHSCIIIQG